MPHFIGRPNDFAFLAGRWQVANRRLRRRLAGCTDWEHFDATSQGWSLLDGGVSVDEIRFASQGGSGCTLRTLDRAARRWSIYWINSLGANLFPPVQGGFIGDHGEFFGEDEDNGKPVQVKFIWEKQGPLHARWAQAFSPDGIKWETNWVMEFTRAKGDG